MEFIYKNGSITLLSEKRKIVLGSEYIDLDGLHIDCAGEYEKSGILMHSQQEEIFYVRFRVEGYWVGYISGVPVEISSEMLEFLGQLDVLIAPFAKSEQKFITQIEPRMLVSFSENASDLNVVFGLEVEISSQYKLKAQDITSDKTSLVVLQNDE